MRLWFNSDGLAGSSSSLAADELEKSANLFAIDLTLRSASIAALFNSLTFYTNEEIESALIIAYKIFIFKKKSPPMIILERL